MAKQLEIRAHPDIKIIGTPHPERGIAYLLEGLIRKETGAEVRVEYIGDKMNIMKKHKVTVGDAAFTSGYNLRNK